MTFSEVFFSPEISELGLRNIGLPKRNRSDFILRFHSISNYGLTRFRSSGCLGI